MAAVSNCHISEVHKMQLEITIGNMPRHHSNCACKSIFTFLMTTLVFFPFKTIYFEIRYSFPTGIPLFCNHICATFMLFKL